MNHQDSGTIIITFLLLLPSLGRAAVSAVTIWREHLENATPESKAELPKPSLRVDLAPALRMTSANDRK